MIHRKATFKYVPCATQLAMSHPLSGVSQPEVSSKKSLKLPFTLSSFNEVDPLSLGSFDESLDATCLDTTRTNLDIKNDETGSQFWVDLLNELNSSNSVDSSVLVSAFLPPPESASGAPSNSQTPPSGKTVIGPDTKPISGLTGIQLINWRLKQLELREAESSKNGSAVTASSLGFTMHQFTDWMCQIKSRLQAAWSSDQRSLALKIAIQSIRVLCIPTPLEFYPMKFVLVSDVLDTLAKLVLERIKDTGSNDGETGRNWWRKVSSIRELLPRLYLQAALLPAASLLSDKEKSSALAGLCMGVRGVGDGVVNLFLRAYITRSIVTHSDVIKPLVSQCILSRDGTMSPLRHSKSDQTSSSELCRKWLFESFLECYAALYWSWSGGDMISINTGVAVVQPVIKYFFKNVSSGSEQLSSFASRLLKCISLNGVENNNGFQIKSGDTKFPSFSNGRFAAEFVWMCPMIEVLSPQTLSELSLTLLRLCETRFNNGWSSEWVSTVLSSIGSSLGGVATIGVAPLPLLNGVMPLLHALHISNYLKPSSAWLSFTARHCTVTETELFLSHILRKVTASDTPVPSELQLLLITMLMSTDRTICHSDTFLSLLGLAHQNCKESSKLMDLVSAVLDTHANSPITNSALADQLIAIAASVHSNHSFLTTEDERRLLSYLVCRTIHSIRLPDVEQQLSLYVSVRASFSQLQTVLSSLVMAVCGLLVHQTRTLRSRNSGDGYPRASFSRACIANAFISIASLVCPVMRVKLYLHTANVARVSLCHGQADSCVKSCIREINTYLSSQTNICTAGCEFCLGAQVFAPELVGPVCSILVITPDPPSVTPSPLYFIKGLLQALTTAGVLDVAHSHCLKVVSQVLGAIFAASGDSYSYLYDGTDELLIRNDKQRKSEAIHLAALLLQKMETVWVNAKNVSPDVSTASCQLLLTLLSCTSEDSEYRDKFSSLIPLLKKLSKSSGNKNVLEWLNSY